VLLTEALFSILSPDFVSLSELPEKGSPSGGRDREHAENSWQRKCGLFPNQKQKEEIHPARMRV
jgi:hypothetical protein